MKKWILNRIWILGPIMMVALFLSVVITCTMGPCNKKTDNVAPQEIVATTWGWSKIVSTPVPVTTTNKGDRVLISQIKFGSGGRPTHTALVPKFIFVCLENWKVGDEVLIAQIPGIFGDIPNPTFIVTDYRSQEQKK